MLLAAIRAAMFLGCVAGLGFAFLLLPDGCGLAGQSFGAGLDAGQGYFQGLGEVVLELVGGLLLLLAVVLALEKVPDQRWDALYPLGAPRSGRAG